MHDILECYERVKQIKGNMVKGAFIAINTDIVFETNNLIPESMIAFKSLKSYHHDKISHLVSFREINSKDVSEQLRLVTTRCSLFLECISLKYCAYVIYLLAFKGCLCSVGRQGQHDFKLRLFVRK